MKEIETIFTLFSLLLCASAQIFQVEVDPDTEEEIGRAEVS